MGFSHPRNPHLQDICVCAGKAAVYEKVFAGIWHIVGCQKITAMFTNKDSEFTEMKEKKHAVSQFSDKALVIKPEAGSTTDYGA